MKMEIIKKIVDGKIVECVDVDALSPRARAAWFSQTEVSEMSEKSNVIQLHPKKLAEIQNMIYDLDPDMVRKGMVGYQNYVALFPDDVALNLKDLVEAVLKAALGGDSTDKVS